MCLGKWTNLLLISYWFHFWVSPTRFLAPWRLYPSLVVYNRSSHHLSHPILVLYLTGQIVWWPSTLSLCVCVLQYYLNPKLSVLHLPVKEPWSQLRDSKHSFKVDDCHCWSHRLLWDLWQLENKWGPFDKNLHQSHEHKQSVSYLCMGFSAPIPCFHAPCKS